MKMNKKRITRDDGRYLIYYTFEEEKTEAKDGDKKEKEREEE